VATLFVAPRPFRLELIWFEIAHPQPSLPGLSGQPIFLKRNKLGRPDKPGDDEFEVIQFKLKPL
jgi:hypothetical protein